MIDLDQIRADFAAEKTTIPNIGHQLQRGGLHTEDTEAAFTHARNIIGLDALLEDLNKKHARMKENAQKIRELREELRKAEEALRVSELHYSASDFHYNRATLPDWKIPQKTP